MQAHSVPPPKHPLRAGALVVGAILVGAVVALRFALHGDLDASHLVAFLERLRGHWWVVPGYLVTYLLLTAAFAPAVLFHMASGVVWGFVVGAAINVVAFNASASAQFAVARWLGRDRVLLLLEHRGLAGFEKRVQENGFLEVLLVRMLPIPTMAVNVCAGVSPIRWRDFALGTVIGTLPVTLIYTYFAAELVKGVAGVQRRVVIDLAICGALLVIVAIAPRLWHKRRQGRTPAAH